MFELAAGLVSTKAQARFTMISLEMVRTIDLEILKYASRQSFVNHDEQDEQAEQAEQ